jgi:hypothetical protein
MEFPGSQSGRENAESGKALPPSAIEPRRLMWAVAEVSWADSAGNPVRSRATMVDISPSGACIRLRDHIGIGARLTIKWHREQFSAIARNCRADGADYLLGVRRDSAPVSEPVPPKAEAAPPEAHQSLSSPAASSVPAREPDAAPRAGTVRDSTPPARTNRSSIPEKRPRDILKESPKRADSELRGAPVRRKAAREERKGMEPKRLFPNLWRRTHEADAPKQAALKENLVHKPTSHAVEPVSDPPERLLSYEDIYHAAGIMSPSSGYDIRKVVEMLSSERIRDLSKDIQRASVLMALDAAGASTDELLQDATRRQQALNAYEDGQRQQLEAFEARKTQENAQIEAEMQRISAHYAERIQQNKEKVTKHKETLHSWQMAKQHENQRISEVIELCGKKPTAAARSDAMAATAGTSGTAAGTSLRTTVSGDTSKRS